MQRSRHRAWPPRQTCPESQRGAVRYPHESTGEETALAHTIRTFPGGLAEVKETPVWKDVIVSLAASRFDPKDVESIVTNPPADVEKDALFITLRTLHAERAEKLAFIKFKRPDDLSESFLFEDELVRIHLGEVIGQIAASHNWDIEKLSQEFEGVRGVPGGFPYQWSFSPLRIACLLRCSDAVQVDQSRAPDFLYALLQIRGVSEQHWRAQNRLATPTPDTKDKNYLIFTSTKTFFEQDAEAWWIAHDAILMADRELENSNRLLRDLDIAGFRINGVKDSRSPARLAGRVKAKGWRPVRAKPRIGNATHVIDMMGGSQLYGRDPSVPLRELIQNAADAVRARRQDQSTSRYEGRVIVSIYSPKEDDDWALSIEDDGIGMSENVLTGPLIEFGTSYWKSDLARSERPGLVSSRIMQTGGFGIGFFSCFMISSRVSITSRQYDAGLGEFRTLEFRKGLSSHPILLDGARPQSSPSVSTRVTVYLNRNDKNNLFSIRSKYHEDENIKITLSQLVAHLCPCLDCDVFTSYDGEELVLAHRSDWYKEQHRSDWLSSVNLAEARKEEGLSNYLNMAVPYLKEFKDAAGRRVGLACVGFREFDTGVTSVGGLISGNLARSPMSFSKKWIGALATLPDGPKRWGGQLAHDAAEMKNWSDQLTNRYAANTNMTPRDYHVACVYTAEFGGCPFPILHAYVNRKILGANNILEILLEKKIIYLPISSVGSSLDRFCIDAVRNTGGFFNFWLGEKDLTPREILVEKLHTNESNPEYYSIPGDENDTTLVGCLIKLADQNGFSWEAGCHPNWELADYVGPDSPRERLISGQILKGPVVWFKFGDRLQSCLMKS